MKPDGVAGGRVALVCMPFASADRPSIQLGLLAELARNAGWQADVHQLNLRLAAHLGPETYEHMCERRSHMTGEWLFGRAAFGADAPGDEQTYYAHFPGEFDWAEEIGRDLSFFTDLRTKQLPAFIDDCIDAVDWGSYSLVGFSSLFQQNVASLALSRGIKERHPSVKIIFGGANMEGEMGREYARAFPFVDYVVSGEGDEAFPTLLRVLAAGGRPFSIPGVIVRTAYGLQDGGDGRPVKDLDALPIPQYGPYFDQVDQLGLRDHYKETWTIPYESSAVAGGDSETTAPSVGSMGTA